MNLQAPSLRIEVRNASATADDVKRLETEIGKPIPLDYRNFLLQFNGGVPYNNTFDVPSVIYSKFLYNFVIARFLGLNPKGQDDILRTRESLKDKMPAGFVPIAIDRFRNFMCLDLETGDILFYDLQSALKIYKPEKPLSFQQFSYKVAGSFNEMLHELYHKRFS